ncbi:hypothetical protein [Arthrobacter sp. KBS0703]|uniref:hypothetical protein n=1 Tax=Arthrobacter sp. KBS0703 TaxID=1955698 RepID=UPI00163D611E|nr:hypothetical protein [Arthrobacter sp. KBS0703]
MAGTAAVADDDGGAAPLLPDALPEGVPPVDGDPGAPRQKRRQARQRQHRGLSG